MQSHHKVLLIHSLACLLAGAALTLAFAPFGYGVIAIISLSILFYSWFTTPPKVALLTGYLFGLGMFGTALNWLHISINLFGGINLTGAYILTYLLIAYLAIYPALAGYFSRRLSNNPALLLLIIIPAIWTVSEILRGYIFTGLPWLSSGYSQTDTLLGNVAPLLGVYGVSWIVCLYAGLITLFIQTNRKLKITVAVIFVLMVSILHTLANVDWTEKEPGGILNVALIQGAIPQEIKWKPEQRQKTVDLYASLSEPYWDKVDLIIWPETAIPMYFHQAKPLVDALQTKSEFHQTDLLTGFAKKDISNNEYFNSIVVIGKNNGSYNKRHLVPFGEFLPLNNLLRPVLNLLSIPMSDFSSGQTRPLLDVAGVKAGLSICFEDVFGEEVIDALPEAGLLINVSNDAWFGDSLAPHQHLQMARMRSIETGRYMLRATNTGISAIISNKGIIESASPQFKPHVLSGQAKVHTGSTVYSRFGNIPVVILMLLLITGAFFFNKYYLIKNN